MGIAGCEPSANLEERWGTPYQRLKIRFPQGSVGSNPALGTNNGKQLVSSFLKSRREGLSPRSIEFYDGYLMLANPVIGLHVTGQDIAQFLDSLGCSNGGKHAYFRTLRAFYNWLYSRKSGHNLNPQDNPILAVEAPKVGKRILPSLMPEQLDFLIEQAECIRDRAIISLFADSGLRLSELANINHHNIDWQHRLIKVTEVHHTSLQGFSSRRIVGPVLL